MSVTDVTTHISTQGKETSITTPIHTQVLLQYEERMVAAHTEASQNMLSYLQAAVYSDILTHYRIAMHLQSNCNCTKTHKEQRNTSVVFF